MNKPTIRDLSEEPDSLYPGADKIGKARPIQLLVCAEHCLTELRYRKRENLKLSFALEDAMRAIEKARSEVDLTEPPCILPLENEDTNIVDRQGQPLFTLLTQAYVFLKTEEPPDGEVVAMELRDPGVLAWVSDYERLMAPVKS